MKSYHILPLLLAGTITAFAQTSEPSIDWQKAQNLFRREQSGEKLSPEDQKYLDRAKEVRRKGGGDRRGGGAQRKAPESLTPLCDMTATDDYEGEDGGLYGKGSNEPPEALQKMAREALAQIKPLDAAGKPSAEQLMDASKDFSKSFDEKKA